METIRGREALVFTEIPYQVNKAAMVEKIGEFVREKRIEGIADMRDESNREGVRIVVEIKRDAMPDVVLNQLYRFSQLQNSFPVNMLALNRGRPEQMGLRVILQSFLVFREQVVTRRAKFRLAKARKRGHETVGLAIAVANIDEVIRTIRESADPGEAKEKLLSRSWLVGDMKPLIELIADPRSNVIEAGPQGASLRLSEEQAKAILELRLHRLTGLGRDDIAKAATEIAEEIKQWLEILASRARILDIIKSELVEVKEAFGRPRRTHFSEAEGEIDDEALITREDMVVTVTHGGYVKRTPLALYRTQRRGGKGRAGMQTKEEDYVTRLFVASTHTPILFFSSRGLVYKEKVWRLPLGDPRARGRALVNILNLDAGDRVTSFMALPEDEADWDRLDVMFATTSGTVRRNKLSDFVDVRRSGIIAMKLDEGEAIVDVQICTETDDILLATAQAMCIRFPVADVRVFQGRTSRGVRGVELKEGDQVIGMAVLRHVDVTAKETRDFFEWDRPNRENGEGQDEQEPADVSQGPKTSFERLTWLKTQEQFILTVTSDGLGKRASSFEYRTTGRGGKGLIAHRLTEKARLVASFPVKNEEELMLVTDKGQLIRTKIDDIRIAGRATQGVILIDVAEDEHVVAAERLEDVGEAEENGETPA
jgi:DNA gyrase subunit A